MKIHRVSGWMAVLVVASVIATSTLGATGTGDKATKPKQVTLTGKIVDLQCHMTEKYPSSDRAKCTRDCIRSGIPAALETKDGLIIIGRDTRGPGLDLLPHAYRDVELKGMLHEKHNLKYLELQSIKPTQPEPFFEEDEPEPQDDDDEDMDDQDD